MVSHAKLIEDTINAIYIQAYLGDIAGLFPDHCNKVNITIKKKLSLRELILVSRGLILHHKFVSRSGGLKSLNAVGLCYVIPFTEIDMESLQPPSLYSQITKYLVIYGRFIMCITISQCETFSSQSSLSLGSE